MSVEAFDQRRAAATESAHRSMRLCEVDGRGLTAETMQVFRSQGETMVFEWEAKVKPEPGLSTGK